MGDSELRPLVRVAQLRTSRGEEQNMPQCPSGLGKQLSCR